MKECPKCGSNYVIMFDSNNDYCQTCKEWFPAVETKKCAAGCKAYYGGEIRHDKGCFFYKDSMSEMLDNALEEIKRLKNKGNK